ncbi:MAG: hypothetical protein ACF8NJ_03195 [Phycisphaerales bacterium JB038]
MMNAPPNEPLTPAGETRRDAMLTELTGYMQQVHRGRRRRRRGGALALLVALSAVIAVAAMSGRSTPPPKQIADNSPNGNSTVNSLPEAPVSLVSVAIVKSDADVMDKYRAKVTTYSNIRVERLDDETLLSELAAMGRPAGLVQMEGKTYLTADVADDAVRERQLNQAPTEPTSLAG